MKRSEQGDEMAWAFVQVIFQRHRLGICRGCSEAEDTVHKGVCEKLQTAGKTRHGN